MVLLAVVACRQPGCWWSCVAHLGFGPGLAADPPLWVCVWGQPATDLVVHPPEVSGVGAQPGF